MSKRFRWITALVTAVAAVVVTASALGTDDPAGELTVFEAGTPTNLDSGLIESLRSSGIAANDAVSVQAPDDSGDRWIVAQGSSNVCLVRRADDGDPIICGTTTILRRGAVVGFTPDETAAASLGLPEKIDPSEPAGTISKPAQSPKASGSVSLYGIAANDVTSAAAVTADGRVLARSAVESNLFFLPDVAMDQVVSIRLGHASGQDTLQPVGFR